MAAKDDILTAVKACADASGDDVLKVSLGTPGSTVLLNGETQATGQAYTVPGFVDCLVDGVGVVIDAIDADTRLTAIETQLGSGVVVMAGILTNATTVSPTVNGGQGISSATKDEGTDTLTINFTSAFSDSNYGVSVILIGALDWHVRYTAIAAGSMTIQFRDTSGVTLDINSRSLRVLVIGT